MIFLKIAILLTFYGFAQSDEQAQCPEKGEFFVHFGWWKSYHFRIVTFVTGTICGDKCSNSPGLCQCGDNTFEDIEGYYCCTPPDKTCEKVNRENTTCAPTENSFNGTLSVNHKINVQLDLETAKQQ